MLQGYYSVLFEGFDHRAEVTSPAEYILVFQASAPKI
jgi:hypothetical protein